MNARHDSGRRLAAAMALTAAVAAAGAAFAFGTGGESPVSRSYAPAPPAPEKQTAQDALAKSLGCASCHTATDHTTMHVNTGVILGCTEIAMLIEPRDSPVPIFDTTRLHAEAAAALALDDAPLALAGWAPRAAIAAHG